jgi:hypothetical protein
MLKRLTSLCSEAIACETKLSVCVWTIERRIEHRECTFECDTHLQIRSEPSTDAENSRHSFSSLWDEQRNTSGSRSGIENDRTRLSRNRSHDSDSHDQEMRESEESTPVIYSLCHWESRVQNYHLSTASHSCLLIDAKSSAHKRSFSVISNSLLSCFPTIRWPNPTIFSNGTSVPSNFDTALTSIMWNYHSQNRGKFASFRLLNPKPFQYNA